MFRSLWCRVGANLRRTSNGQTSSSPPAARYNILLFTLQNPIVVTKNPRVTSMFFCSSSSISDSAFVVSYLINSCGLSEKEAITVSRKVNFKTPTQPDSILSLFENYGFTKPYISKLITKRPLFLLSDPLKTLKPKLDFYNSKGIHGIELAVFVTMYPEVLTISLKSHIIPSFDILKSILGTDTNVVKTLRRSSWILKVNTVERLMVNLELLRYEGVPQSTISKYLITKPRSFTGDPDKFKEVVEKVKGMGFDPLTTAFVEAIQGLATMCEATWKTKVGVYKRCGWSEVQIQTAFRKDPHCMTRSENKITAVMDFLVNEMGYDALSIAENPRVIRCSLKERIIPRCSVIRVLVSKGLIEGKIPLNSLSTKVDEYFVDKFVTPYEKEAPELMKVFKGQLSYKELLLK